MKGQHSLRTQRVRRGDGLSPTDPSLLATPLEFLCEDHVRERQVCAVIDRLASYVSFDQSAAQTVLQFVNEELNLHMRDEAEDLFPLLARRCPAEDGIRSVISRICSDLDEAARLLPGLRDALARCLDTGATLTVEDRQLLIRFAGHVRRHLAAENAILLPIASARLTRCDLQKLSRQMRTRRGLPPVMDTPDAD
ncbi:hemerythrin domain-containing protein [Tabrizicola sp.]|uniref:hemerythrin domain-containing protein n=1 Tax=Tabrizicola sp. TaxID=2005166 RepID=UPI003F3B5A6F